MKRSVVRRVPLLARVSKAELTHGCLAITLFTLIGVILGKGF